MDARLFLREFGHIANAPGGIGQLRDLVLHLAVSGDLTSTEVPIDASPLLNAIEQQKRNHPERRKVVAKQATVSRAAVKVPSHWVVCRLGDLALTITGGGTPSKNHPAYWGGLIPWASVKDMKELKFLDDTEDHITEEGLKNSSSNLIPPGRIIVCTRMGLGKAAINRVALAINQDLKALELPKEVNTDYFLILYKTREVKGTGTTVSGIKQDQLLALPAALPPIDEQSLIVDKVGELMALCDKLETQQQARRKLQDNLRLSTLQAVASATSPHELKSTWTRLADNFGRLFHAPEDVRLLRDVIFDLALRGTLLPNAKSDGPAVVFTEEASPLPNDWHWETLSELSEYITSGSRGWKGYIASTGDSFIRSQDIKHDALVFESPAFVSLPVKAEGKRTLVRQGDILLTITGANVGKCATVPALSQDAYVSQHVALIRLREPWLAEFVHFWMINAFGGRQFLSRYIYGDKPGLNLTQVGSVPIPVPPKSACIAILNNLRNYQKICVQLEAQLKTKQKMASTLASATVSSLTGVTFEQKEEPMKAPQTELIASLRLWQTPDIKAQAPLATILTRHNGEMPAKDLWQRFGGEIDAFYAQLKTEVAHGWIMEPEVAEMREKQADAVSA
jgi:type I restriction enzyme S subunit